MSKRTWIVVLIALALGIVLSACGSGDLAEDLTPIPTLPPGQEPELVEALQNKATPMAITGGGEMTEADQLAKGESLFGQNCAGCHGAADGVGPSLPSLAVRAATEAAAGQTVETYLYESIVEPAAQIAEGFQGGIMPQDFGDRLTAEDLDSLVVYIMSQAAEGTATETPAEAALTEVPAEASTETPTEAAAPEPDPALGEELFTKTCTGCHGAADGVGPTLVGIASRVEEELAEGQTIEEFLHESIVNPGAKIAEGFQDGIMPKMYGQTFDEHQIKSIVAYLLTQ